MTVLRWVFLPVVGYLIGSLAFAVWLPLLLRGVDIREGGSGHAGTTNAIRQVGWGIGVLVFLLDVGKGWLAVTLAQRLDAPLPWLALTGALAVVGHNWPLFARFRGGMGNATAFGALLAVSPLAALIALGWVIFWTLVLHHAARGTLLAAATAWLLLWALRLGPQPLALALAIGPILVVRFASDWNRRYRELWLDRPQ